MLKSTPVSMLDKAPGFQLAPENLPAPVCVLGLGNILYGDEGTGIHALRALQASCPREDIDWVDGGVLGLNLLPLVETSPALLILDCVDQSLPPGSVIDMPGSQIPLFSGQKLSEHQLSFQEVLALARVRSALPPRLHLVGVQPASFELGLELSPVVQAAMPEVVRRAMKVLKAWE